ncbi:hypothetical protein FHR32_004553 [Streptosporangium album]|uniref:Uncharacterized protein n=1 Tax=Streptosporangium album TaxID=47479 RepID=A0A7W7RXT5_9ACTN|nr:hypothetical protein [Streptosporangium album]MBB4940248.1 hypothetical protein [Streptosporangium album]
MDERPHRAWPPEESGRRGLHRARPPQESGGDGRPGAWPSEGAGRRGRRSAGEVPQDDLPPSARWYGAPAAPPRRRVQDRLRRRLLGLVALLAGAGALIAVGVVLVPRILPSSSPAASSPAGVSDPLAGVGYPLPAGWRVGAVPPVTGFTSVAGREGAATVMAMPAEPVNDTREATVELADLYARLLLHGDEVKVVDDRAVTVGGRSGHSRSLRAEYQDVNRPSYLRVVFLSGAGTRPVVVLGMAQPDDPRLRAEIDTVIAGVR